MNKMDLDIINDEIDVIEKEQIDIANNKRTLCVKINKILEFLFKNSKYTRTFNGYKVKFTEFDIWIYEKDYYRKYIDYKLEKNKKTYFYQKTIDQDFSDMLNFVLAEYNRILNRLNQNLKKEGLILDQLKDSLNGTY